ncbi:MAG: efflux RND transporter permease subunit, partial [Myxococcales bacterium]|nr:efflux RND transporter permease subunit [Myxococcales bacterium]
PRQLQALGVAPAQVVDALRAANVVVPSGNLDDGVQALNLQPTGLVTSLREIEETVVAVRGGRSVLVRDVA